MPSPAAANVAYRSGSGSAAARVPPALLVMKPAQRLAMFTSLPTRSEFSARDEVVQIEVDVVDAAAELGGEVVAQRLGLKLLEIAPRGDEGAARLRHLLRR